MAELGQRVCLFHGTSWSQADAIREVGLRVGERRPGVYLSSSRLIAMVYACMRAAADGPGLRGAVVTVAVDRQDVAPDPQDFDGAQFLCTRPVTASEIVSVEEWDFAAAIEAELIPTLREASKEALALAGELEDHEFLYGRPAPEHLRKAQNPTVLRAWLRDKLGDPAPSSKNSRTEAFA